MVNTLSIAVVALIIYKLFAYIVRTGKDDSIKPVIEFPLNVVAYVIIFFFVKYRV